MIHSSLYCQHGSGIFSWERFVVAEVYLWSINCRGINPRSINRRSRNRPRKYRRSKKSSEQKSSEQFIVGARNIVGAIKPNKKSPEQDFGLDDLFFSSVD